VLAGLARARQAHWTRTVILPRAMPEVPGRSARLANCRLEAPDMNSKLLYKSNKWTISHILRLLLRNHILILNKIKSSIDSRVKSPCSVF